MVVSLRVPDLVSTCWWEGPVPDMAGCRVWGVGLLVSGAGSWDSWLRGPRCLGAGMGLLVGGAGAQGVLELVLACLWVGCVLVWEAARLW